MINSVDRDQTLTKVIEIGVGKIPVETWKDRLQRSLVFAIQLA